MQFNVLEKKQININKKEENILYFLQIYALLAQSVEHFHGKEGVAGSIPAVGSNTFLPIGEN